MSIPLAFEWNVCYKSLLFSASFAVGEEHRAVDLVVKDFISSINVKNVFRPLVAVRICMRKLLGEKSDLAKTLSFCT